MCFVFGCFLSSSAFSLSIGPKHNAWKNLFDCLFQLIDRQGTVHQIIRYRCFSSCCACYTPLSPLHLLQKYVRALLLWFLFTLIVHLLGLSFVFTRGSNHVGNSGTDGPRGTSPTDMLSHSNNLQLPEGSVLLLLQVYIPAASSPPGLALL